MLVDIQKVESVAKEEEQKGALVQSSAESLSIQNESEYQVAAQLLLQVKEKAKALDEQRKTFVQPLNKVVKEINAFFKAPISSYEKVEQTLKAEMGRFQMEAARLRQEALTRAAEAAQNQQKESFSELMATALDHAPVKAQGTFTREVWRFEVTDPSAIPREYLMVDERKIGDLVRQMKDRVNIPGVRVWSDTTVVARG